MHTPEIPDACPGVARSGYFVDVEAGERLEDGEVWDAHGTPLIGYDDDGFWWGTERAAWVLHEHPFTVVIHGTLAGSPYDGYFVGAEDAAVDYAETHGVIVAEVESGDPSWDARQLRRYRQRQIAQNAKG